jgi:hypothetical protein
VEDQESNMPMTQNVFPSQVLYLWLGKTIAIRDAVENRILVAKLMGYDSDALVILDSDGVTTVLNRRDVAAIWQATDAEIDALTKED